MTTSPQPQASISAPQRERHQTVRTGSVDPIECSVGFCVVIVHWNQPEACLLTIEQFRRQGKRVEFIVVDNGSDPDALVALSKITDPDVTIVESGFNAGFGPGANVGLAEFLARGTFQWCLLCPHDVDLYEGCLRDLAAGISTEPLAGLACADVGDGEVPVLDPYFGGITKPGETEPGWERADYPHGTLMALNRDCLEEVGLFDETYFAYCEEAELGWRARKAGWAVGLVRGARVQNRNIGTSIAVVDYLQTRNTLALVRSVSGRYHVFIRICLSLIHVVHGLIDPDYAPPIFHPRARLLAIRHFLMGRSGPPPLHLYRRPT